MELPSALISVLAPLVVLPMDCPAVGHRKQLAWPAFVVFLQLPWPPLQPALYLTNSQQVKMPLGPYRFCVYAPLKLKGHGLKSSFTAEERKLCLGAYFFLCGLWVYFSFAAYYKKCLEQ